MRAALLAALLLVAGCGALLPARMAAFRPAPDGPADRASARYEAQLRAILASYLTGRSDPISAPRRRASGLVPIWTDPAISTADALAARMTNPTIAPLPPSPPGERSYDGRWRLALSWLYISKAREYSGRSFHFSGINALESRIMFRSLDWRPARIRASCDGPVRLAGRDADTEGRYAAGEAFSFTLHGRSRDHTWLAIAPATDRCELEVRIGTDAPRTLHVERTEAVDPALARLDSSYDVCATPRDGRMDALERAFFASRWLSQTCSADPGPIRLLPRARDGYNAKVAALAGRELPDAVFDAGDPTAPIDMSRAPRLDLIVLSYLDLKADFSGFIMERLLRFHARRGARIRILVSGLLENAKDRALYEGLAADFPNVELQFFDWNPPDFAPAEEQIASLHRVNHIKLFATLSPQPGRSRAILGGRNIHDGFLFSRALDLSRFPWLQNYGRPGEFSLNYFSSYLDFEIELKRDATIRNLIAQVATFWNRDAATSVFRPFSVAVEEASPGDVPLTGARHFMSVPYLDRGALETYWVDLIDAARARIEIVTPYLNPTPRIEAALNRALARGIDVRIVARIRLEGDLGGRLMTEMNMLFVERYAARLKLWEYDPPDVVLHTKILVVDGRLSVVTSANLNRRSFLHDTENGLAILDPVFARKLAGVVQDYISKSRRLTPADSDVRPWVRDLFSSGFVRNFF